MWLLKQEIGVRVANCVVTYREFYIEPEVKDIK
jgi:hypothetical protein